MVLHIWWLTWHGCVCQLIYWLYTIQLPVVILSLFRWIDQPMCVRRSLHWKNVINTIKPAHMVTSIKQSPVLKGDYFSCSVIENFIQIEPLFKLEVVSVNFITTYICNHDAVHWFTGKFCHGSITNIALFPMKHYKNLKSLIIKLLHNILQMKPIVYGTLIVNLPEKCINISCSLWKCLSKEL